MGRVGLPELLVIFLIIVVLFGAKRLPEIGAALGKAIREFRKASKEFEHELKNEKDREDDKKG